MEFNEPIICHQRKRRVELFEQDLLEFNLTPDQVMNLTVHDFEIKEIPKADKKKIAEAKEFIIKYEWLKSLPQRVTRMYGAYLQGKLSGVVVFSTPNMFSKLMGEETKQLEQLIGRGASASITPTNLASYMLTRCIKHMVDTTPYRLFCGYSDLTAGERGKIYQALNFMYLGEKFGGSIQLFDKNTPQKGWFSDREVRKLSMYKKFAKELGISWDSSWNIKSRIIKNNMSPVVRDALKFMEKHYISSCEVRKLPKKRKYISIHGRTRPEAKRLLNRFYELNPQYQPKGPNVRPGLPYPKD